jgi:heme-degrading monooxygenase HmoA
MFVSIRRYQVKPGSISEVASRVQKGLVPLLSTQPGFVSYQAVDPGNNTALSISVYQDRASADAANKTAAQWVQSNLSGLISAVDVSVGEVVASSAETIR